MRINPTRPFPSSPHSMQGQGIPTIRKGSSGLYVAYCQNLLNRRVPGQMPLWVDGIFGLNTEARVKQFQMSRGLQADGVVGPMTWGALEAGPPLIKKRPAMKQEMVVPVAGGF